MPDWIWVYAGCIATGVIFGGALSAGGSWLYQRLDDEKHWSAVHDAVTVSAITAASVLVAAGIGAVYGHDSASMGNSWKIGGIWGGAGGVLSPWLFQPLRSGAVSGIRAAAKRIARKEDEQE